MESSKLNASLRRGPTDSSGNRVTRDEEKRKKVANKKKREFFDQLRGVGCQLRNDPAKWQADDFRTLRDLFKYILEHSDQYPVDTDVHLEQIMPSAAKTFDHAGVQEKLTSGFVISLTEPNANGAFHQGASEPVVQVVDTDRGRYQTFSSRFENVKIVELTVVDADGSRLKSRVAPHLTDMAVHLRRGHLLKLGMFNDVMMRVNEDSPYQAAIAITQMTILGSGPLLKAPEQLIHPSTYSIEEIVEVPTTRKSSTVPINITEQHEPPPLPSHPCSYGNRHCTMHGLNFRVCICCKIPVNDQDLETIRMSCPFASASTVASMDASKKRFLLYWWYATNIFMICGKRNRAELPECLVYAIRCRFPNEKGVPYVGFNEASRDKRRRL